MSIYVTCQCGQAFSAPPQLAGKTLPCPSCQRPITVPATEAPVMAELAPVAAPAASPFGAPAANPFGAIPNPLAGAAGAFGAPASPFGAAPAGFGPAADPFASAMPLGGAGFADPFGSPAGAMQPMGLGMGGADPFGGQMGISPAMGMPGMPTAMPAHPQMPQQMVRGEEESPLIMWLAIVGGGGALLLIIGMLIYNGSKKSGQPVASNPTTTTPAMNTPATSPASAMTPGVTIPAGTSPATSTPSTAPTSPFTPPSYGQFVASADNQFEVWMPAAPTSQEQSLLGGKIVTKKAVFPDSPGKFFALITGLGPDDGSKPEDLFKGTRNGLERGGASDISESRITFAGQSAQELQGTILGVKLRQVSFMVGRTAYSLQATDVGGDDSEETKNFWASFRKVGTGQTAGATPEIPFTPPNYGQMISSPNGLYEVWMPHAASESKVDDIKGLGASLKAKISQEQSPFSIYMFIEANFPTPVTPELFEQTTKQFNNAQPVKFERGKKFGIDVVQGEWQLNAFGEIRPILTTFVPVGSTVYILQWSGEATLRDKNDVKTFLASFRKVGSGPAVIAANDPTTTGSSTKYETLALGDGEFQILIPNVFGEAKTSTDNYLTSKARGDLLMQDGHSEGANRTNFTVMQYKLAQDVDEELFAGRRKYYATFDNYKEQQTKLAGMDAWQIDHGVTGSPVTNRIMLVGKGKFLWELQCVGVPEDVESKAFFNSFRKPGAGAAPTSLAPSALTPSPSVPAGTTPPGTIPLPKGPKGAGNGS